jgi:hypothetical protein
LTQLIHALRAVADAQAEAASSSTDTDS